MRWGIKEDGYFTLMSMVIITMLIFVWAVIFTGYASFQKEVLTKERLHSALYRAAFVASEQGGWDGTGFVLSSQSALAEFNDIFPPSAGLTMGWGPISGGAAVAGPVGLQSFQVFQTADVGKTAVLYCPATGQAAKWKITAPGVLAAIVAPVEVSVLGMGVFDQEICVAAFATPPWWDAPAGVWK